MASIPPQGQPAAVECPHIHFKTNVIDRDILTKRQHLNLLCTPRGYRWEVVAVKKEEQSLVCSSNPHGKPKRSYVYNVLADLWSIVTPKMAVKLRDMMVTEFGLSKEEASDFVAKQMKEMFRTLDKRSEKGAKMSRKDAPFPLFISKDIQESKIVRCRCHMPLKLDPCVVKDITHALAAKLTEVAMFMMDTKKGLRQRRMSEVLFNGICKLSGETFNPKKPQSNFQKLQLFLADKLGMWLAENIVDEKVDLDKKRKKEDKSIRARAVKRAKEYEKEVRHRATLARKIELQKRVAKEREKEAKLKDEESKKMLEESRKKKMEEWMKKDEARKKQAKSMRMKEHAKKKDKEKKAGDARKKQADAKMKREDSKKKLAAAKTNRDVAKNKQKTVQFVGDIVGKAEMKNLDSKEKKKK